MNRCIKGVVGLSCHYCFGPTIKFGKVRNQQRYRCKNCSKTQISHYKKEAYKPYINSQIISHVKEGCGIRSIARLLHISAGTVLRRIKYIAGKVRRPLPS